MFNSVLKDEGLPGSLVTVTVGREGGTLETFRVQAGILSHHSAFFRAALSGSWHESKTKSVALPEDDPVAFGRILCYMYGRDVIDVTSLSDVFQLLTLADKLMMDDTLAQIIASTKMQALMNEGKELTAGNIRLAYSIPGAGPVAKIFAKYSVKKYMVIMHNKETYPKQKFVVFEFAKELEEVHRYAIDLMGLVAHAIRMCVGRPGGGPTQLIYWGPVTEKFERAGL